MATRSTDGLHQADEREKETAEERSDVTGGSTTNPVMNVDDDVSMQSSHLTTACPFCYAPSLALSDATERLEQRQCSRCGKRWAVDRMNGPVATPGAEVNTIPERSPASTIPKWSPSK
jgi:hypothetical protein